MTIFEKMKEIWAKEGQQRGENWEDFQARCNKEETWLFYTLPIILEVVEALNSLVMACKLPGDHCDVEQALLAVKDALAKINEEVE